MTTKFLYTVYPEDPSKMTNIADVDYPLPSGDFYAIVSWGVLISGLVGLVYIFVNLFAGGYNWIVFVGISIVCGILASKMRKEAKFEYQKLKAKEEAEILSGQLNKILNKSEEIVNNILPYLESMVKKNIETAKIDFADNALSPFWDRIEESTNYLGCFKDAVDQLAYNSEIYKKVLEDRSHNFPTPFPIGTNISISQTLIDDFYSIIRKAQTKFEFANIWEHKKTQKILIEGFRTLADAINNMSNAIVAAISDLKHSIRSDFRELKNIQIEQIKSFESGQNALNATLSSMDKKLYYMQYNKKPITPFLRPLSDF